MKRRPEPELMDDPVQAAAYAAADFSEPHALFVEQCLAFIAAQGLEVGSVLDLGCGPADITVRLAQALPGARITAVEAAEAMLDLACERVADEGLIERIELVQGRVPDCALPEDGFDLVVSNSLLHHLESADALWRTILAWSRPGAGVFVMDLRRPETLEQARRLADDYAGDEPEILYRDFYRSLRAAYRPDEVEAQLAAHGLAEGLTVTVPSDRHLVVSGRLPG